MKLNSLKSFRVPPSHITLYTTIVVRQDLPKTEKYFSPYIWFPKGPPVTASRRLVLFFQHGDMNDVLDTLREELGPGFSRSAISQGIQVQNDILRYTAQITAGRQVAHSTEFNNHERFLREHRWSEMLTEPGAEEKKRVTQVFYGFYSMGREAEKNGWKNIFVQSTQLNNRSAGTGRFKQPYPQSHWRPLPVGDKTNKQLCRPLPANKVAPPPRVEQPDSVAGSASWTQTKNAGASTSMAWDKDVLLANYLPASALPQSTQASTYPLLSRIATSARNKTQPSSNNALPPLEQGPST
ncbi:hypothetical protein BYT27DRAFT_7340002 [Phlegmacium glaucopus]|nr:hypothetical protein BYT27DRAFT_7340002 [Phlegmacium glaucopus]